MSFGDIAVGAAAAARGEKAAAAAEAVMKAIRSRRVIIVNSPLPDHEAGNMPAIPVPIWNVFFASELSRSLATLAFCCFVHLSA
jgi:hypothetical protein